MPKYKLRDTDGGYESGYESEGGTLYSPKKELGKGAFARARLFMSNDKPVVVLAPENLNEVDVDEAKVKEEFFTTLYPKFKTILLEVEETNPENVESKIPSYRLVIPYIDGIPLNELDFGCEKLNHLYLLRSVVNTLMKCHERNLVVVDLKRDNVLFNSEKGKIYLIDGGQSRKVGAPLSQALSLKGEKLEDVRKKYTQYAPECWGEGTEQKTAAKEMDIYSFGKMIKEVLGDSLDTKIKEWLDLCQSEEPDRRPQLKDFKVWIEEQIVELEVNNEDEFDNEAEIDNEDEVCDENEVRDEVEVYDEDEVCDENEVYDENGVRDEDEVYDEDEICDEFEVGEKNVLEVVQPIFSKYILGPNGEDIAYLREGVRFTPAGDWVETSSATLLRRFISEDGKCVMIEAPVVGSVLNLEVPKDKLRFFMDIYPNEKSAYFEWGEDNDLVYRLQLPYLPGITYDEYLSQNIPTLQKINLFLFAIDALIDCHDKGYVIDNLDLKNIVYDDQTQKSYIVPNLGAQKEQNEEKVTLALGQMMNKFFLQSEKDLAGNEIRDCIFNCMSEDPKQRPTLDKLRENFRLIISKGIQCELIEYVKVAVSKLTTSEEIAQQVKTIKKDLEKIVTEKAGGQISLPAQEYQTMFRDLKVKIKELEQELQEENADLQNISTMLEEIQANFTNIVSERDIDVQKAVCKDLLEYTMKRIQRESENRPRLLVKIEEAYKARLHTLDEEEKKALQKLREKEEEIIKKIRDIVVDYTEKNTIDEVAAYQQTLKDQIVRTIPENFQLNTRVSRAHEKKLNLISDEANAKIQNIINANINKMDVNYDNLNKTSEVDKHKDCLLTELKDLYVVVTPPSEETREIELRKRCEIMEKAESRKKIIEINDALNSFDPVGLAVGWLKDVNLLRGHLKVLNGEVENELIVDKMKRIKFLIEKGFYKHFSSFNDKLQEFKHHDSDNYKNHLPNLGQFMEALKDAKTKYLRGETDQLTLINDLSKAIKSAIPTLKEHRGWFLPRLRTWLYNLLQTQPIQFIRDWGLFKTQSMEKLDAFINDAGITKNDVGYYN